MILCLCTLLSALTGGLIVFLTELSPFWLFLFLPAGFLAWSLLYLLFIWIVSKILPYREGVEVGKQSKFCYFFIRVTMRWVMQILRVRVKWIGQEQLPAEPFMLVSNHLSDFDPMVVLSKPLDLHLFYISKPENFNLPLIGRYIRGAGFMAIDRENPIRAIRTLRAAGALMVNEKLCMGIYPEGTRSKTGKLQEFKDGAFLTAKRTGVPIAVMVTTGTDRIPKNIPFRSTRVTLKVLGVIDAETVKATPIADLCRMSREMIAKDLGQDGDAEQA